MQRPRFARSIAALVTAAAASLSFGAASPGPAAAAELGGVITCAASLPWFPGNGYGTCTGSYYGARGGTVMAPASFSASFTYLEPCPPVIGSAQGTTSIGGVPGPYFFWTRVGLTAVIVLSDSTHTGAGAGLFIPTTVPGPANAVVPCPGSPLNAQVVAAGAAFGQ